MDLRSYYLSRFPFLIIWSIVTDMKCQSHSGINAALYDWILFTYGLKLEELSHLTGLQTQQNFAICKILSVSFMLPFANSLILNPREAIIYLDIIIMFMITASHGKPHSNIRSALMRNLDWIIIMTQF